MGQSNSALPSDRAVAADAAEPEVSALRASIPSADPIPSGQYCYASITDPDANGYMRIKGMCPYYENRAGEKAYCRFLDYETEFERELLWDQVKICGVKNNDAA